MKLLMGNLCWNCPSLNILPDGQVVVRRPGSPENAGAIDFGFDSRRSAPVRTSCLISNIMIMMIMIMMMRIMINSRINKYKYDKDESFGGIVPASKFYLMGGSLFGARAA